jgi:hypothetical protein
MSMLGQSFNQNNSFLNLNCFGLNNNILPPSFSNIMMNFPYATLSGMSNLNSLRNNLPNSMDNSFNNSKIPASNSFAEGIKTPLPNAKPITT